MENVSLGKKRLVGGVSTLLLIGSLLVPVSASASTVLPMQVLPPGTGRSCAPVTFSDIQAHVNAGHLDSFDITLSDPSYVAVSTSVDSEAIGLNYVTRWAYPDGSIKMHVDLQAIQMNRDVPVQITFMSAYTDANGQGITCMFNVPAVIEAVMVAASPVSGRGTEGGTPSTRPGGVGSGAGATSAATSTATSSYNPGIVAAMNSLGSLCADGGATRLWVVLLVLYVLFVFTLCAQKFQVNTSIRDWNVGLILAVFIGLLVFWYVSAACRTGPWAPAIATLIAIVGLLYTMLKGDELSEVLLLKDGRKK
jgi:hypothetical protein